MKYWVKVLALCLLIITITLFIILESVIFPLFTSSFDGLNQSDYQNFANIGEQLFILHDQGYINVGEVISSYDYEEKVELKKALLKYDSTISNVYFVNENVMFLEFDALFQSIDGIAITRNNAELKNTYENTGFDEGSLRYTKLIPNVYHFNAGL